MTGLGDEEGSSYLWKCFLVSIGCLQNYLMGGVIFGWAAISSTLLVADCGIASGRGLGLSAHHVHDMFVFASTANMCSPLLLGLVLDRHGPRTCSLLSVACSAAGFALLAYTAARAAADCARPPPPPPPPPPPALGHGHGDSPMRLGKDATALVGAVLVGFGGPGVQASVLHLGRLFPNRQGLVVCAITGAFQLGFGNLVVLDRLWALRRDGLDACSLLAGYAALCASTLVASAALWPDRPINHPPPPPPPPPHTPEAGGGEEDGAVKGTTEGASRAPRLSLDRKTEMAPSAKAPPSSPGRLWPMPLPPSALPEAAPLRAEAAAVTQATAHHPNPHHHPGREAGDVRRRRDLLKGGSLLTQLRSREFLSATLLLTVGSFWANLCVGSLGDELESRYAASVPALARPDQRAAAMRTFTVVSSALGVLGIPFVGHCMDRWGFCVAQRVTVALGAAWTTTKLVVSVPCLYAGFALYALFRSFLFNFFFAFLADALGFRHFGFLAGLGFSCAGVTGLLLEGPVLALALATHRDVGDDDADATAGGGTVGGAGGAGGAGGRWGVVAAAQLLTIALVAACPAAPPKAPPAAHAGAGGGAARFEEVRATDDDDDDAVAVGAGAGYYGATRGKAVSLKPATA